MCRIFLCPFRFVLLILVIQFKAPNIHQMKRLCCFFFLYLSLSSTAHFADIYGGYVCFVVSIFAIGVVTAVIGDVASHFGCTLGIKDSVTAIVFVALGTSVPGLNKKNLSTFYTRHRSWRVIDKSDDEISIQIYSAGQSKPKCIKWSVKFYIGNWRTLPPPSPPK